MAKQTPAQSACEYCGGDHATDQHWAAMQREARTGKRVFVVRVIQEERFRVWADDLAKAEDAVYWRRSARRRRGRQSCLLEDRVLMAALVGLRG